MAIVAHGVCAALALWAAGAGYAVWALGPRWARLWPALAPVLGLSVLVVASDGPAFFLGARQWSLPLAALTYGGSLALAVRHRGALRGGQWWFLLAAGPALLAALGPMLREGVVTTLSRGNHDYVFYDALAQSLRQRGYGSDGVDRLLTADLTTFVLRHGGWRSGLSQVTAFFGALTGRPMHQVDALVWATAFTALPGAALVAFELVRPASSKGARALVLGAAALGAPAVMLLRDAYASHLVSLPLMLVWAGALTRSLATRAPGLLAVAAVTLGASLSVLADGAPLFLAVWAATALLLARARPWARARVLARAVAAGALGVAAVPFMLTRMLWQLQSLALTGYLGARGGSVGGVDALAGDLLQLVPPALFVSPRPVLGLREEPLPVALAVGVGVFAAAALLRRLPRLRGPSRVLALALGASYLVELGLLQLTDKHYPAWKLALSVGAFAPVLVGLALDAGRRRVGAALAAGWLAAMALVTGYEEWSRPAHVGVRAEPLEVMRRLDALDGELFMVGTVGGEGTLAWAHPLALLAAERGRPLHHTPHRYSYFTLSAPTKRPRHDGRREYAVVVAPAESDVEGPLVFQAGPVEVRDVSGPAGRALSFGFIEDGWYEAERDQERRFRWSRQRSAVSADFGGKGCWAVDARALVPEARLDVRFGASSWAWPLGLDWRRFRIPAEAFGTHRIDFDYTGPVAQIPGETRALHFALATPRWVPGCDAP
ncbi:MAG: hypothetical protein INH41_03395 [Myxococcaceae bacterium]|jgi:hypothetical protein|nr:hypothetical protein [Myxococcaceae bacterium]MCA3011424.1 hypothetical protein [Myxococcaceae bacterium]